MTVKVTAGRAPDYLEVVRDLALTVPAGDCPVDLATIRDRAALSGAAPFGLNSASDDRLHRHRP